IYVSHVHPDHFDPETMKLIDPATPVLIHSFHQKFLKANIERLGFTVRELENATRVELAEGVNFAIYAADNCDPSVCGHLFGCVSGAINGSLQIDSLCVISTEDHVLVNTNDCPYEIAHATLKEVKRDYPEIDYALVGYTTASLYPHCMIEYDAPAKAAGRERARKSGLIRGLRTLQVLKPRYYTPFAGTYIIGGSEYEKNAALPQVEIEDAAAEFQADAEIEAAGCRPVLLNLNATFDLSGETQDAPYTPVDREAREIYIRDVARHFPYAFEAEEVPSAEELSGMFGQARERLRRKQTEIGLFDDTNLVFDLPDGNFTVINLSEEAPKQVADHTTLPNYVRFQLDPRLLKRVLLGPRYANWNNIEIGAVLGFARKPDVYRQDVHILINALHV
ncbi:MAG: hypothetical protein AAFQ17_05485, partial [Pseudomonadota bacterium]